jgi:hypothetical protein
MTKSVHIKILQNQSFERTILYACKHSLIRGSCEKNLLASKIFVFESSKFRLCTPQIFAGQRFERPNQYASIFFRNRAPKDRAIAPANPSYAYHWTTDFLASKFFLVGAPNDRLCTPTNRSYWEVRYTDFKRMQILPSLISKQQICTSTNSYYSEIWTTDSLGVQNLANQW